MRNYLQYAASNGRELGDADISGVPLNAFESDGFDCLEAAGLKLISQMGASQFQIDMVAQHPAKPGRYVLAIEFDGATYHSSYTARARDRLRQQQLENLGWRFHRIWSTDWFMRREEEIQRAIESLPGSCGFCRQTGPGSNSRQPSWKWEQPRACLCSARLPQKRAQASDPSSHLNCSIHFDRADSIAPVDCFRWPVENGSPDCR